MQKKTPDCFINGHIQEQMIGQKIISQILLMKVLVKILIYN